MNILPSAVRGMKILNRDMFKQVLKVPAIKIRTKLCSYFRSHFADRIFRYNKIGGFHDCDDPDYKLLLLDPSQDLSSEELSWISDHGGTATSKNLELSYDNHSVREILSAILPPETVKDVPSGFEECGHIAHLNLRDDQLPYKEIIGQVILDKQPGIETVVNKVDCIDETFRFFKMEVLAGKEDMMATVKENGCTFTFDYSKVYWNSRLRTEHQRIIEILKPNDVVMDVFAGVGPFAIPACRKGCIVHANDLNPIAYSSLISNAEKNKVKTLRGYCMDGREFIKKVVQELIAEYKGDGPLLSHVLMNLPAIAVEFLDVFKGIFASLPLNFRSTTVLPRVHCYCFTKNLDPIKHSLHLVETNLGAKLEEGTFSVFQVRTVAPSKAMMRVSFNLPSSVAYWTGESESPSEGMDLLQLKGVKRPSDDGIEGTDSEGLGCSPPSAKKEKV